MKTVEIIVHCWAEKISEFAAMLTAQLSSLVQWPPDCCEARVTVITTPSDSMTLSTVEFFSRFIPCCALKLEPKYVLRRAIGRNMAALVSQADYVWFCDADYLFGRDCLDVLCDSGFKGLAYPRAPMIHKSHTDGDAEIARIRLRNIFDPDLTLFVPWRVKFAIGGLQIVDGDTARRIGYLDKTRWVEPTTADDFQNTKEDRIYRGMFPNSTALEIPNLYRMRHSRSAFQSADSRLSSTKKASNGTT